ncbi:peptide deformylase [Deinococcus cellulosilyticus]|uniref:Peptide deformylase n=1 Tax=Deinococcus cellulosilyticus (strain DSM 18568 / NBRC 106333 / KACC 11606 / 5516J-15) TaxID=1223518 RepID=A0A511N7L6_DEIC1|nr:peptide deformylase [Deinococcus cellulosilyticus]GEM48497.1 peptide deformylase [Deinococcus cellulosilyticus NBRC 106333 = KACC 11606]
MTRVYPLRYYGDPILRKHCTPIADLQRVQTVPGFGAVSIKDLAENMMETMFDAYGVGLAAPQIGLPIRMFVAAEYHKDGPEGDIPLSAQVKRHIVAINPTLEILDPTLRASHTDGCLSMPGMWSDDVQRPTAIRLTYTDQDGEQKIEEAEGHWARVLQHEFDHLNGRLYIDLLPPSYLQEHRKTIAQLQKRAKAYLKAIESKR